MASGDTTAFGRFVEKHVKPIQILLASVVAVSAIAVTVWKFSDSPDRSTPTFYAAGPANFDEVSLPTDRLYVLFYAQDPSDGQWKKSISAFGLQPVITFLVRFRNMGTTQLDDVTLRAGADSAALSAVFNSASFATSKHPNGVLQQQVPSPAASTSAVTPAAAVHGFHTRQSSKIEILGAESPPWSHAQALVLTSTRQSLLTRLSLTMRIRARSTPTASSSVGFQTSRQRPESQPLAVPAHASIRDDLAARLPAWRTETGDELLDEATRTAIAAEFMRRYHAQLDTDAARGKTRSLPSRRPLADHRQLKLTQFLS